MMSSGSYWSYREAGAFDCDPEDRRPDVKVLHSGEHAARRQHSCEACDGLILPGQRYRKLVMILGGDFEVHKEHSDRGQCAEMRKAVEEFEARRHEHVSPGPDETPF